MYQDNTDRMMTRNKVIITNMNRGEVKECVKPWLAVFFRDLMEKEKLMKIKRKQAGAEQCKALVVAEVMWCWLQRLCGAGCGGYVVLVAEAFWCWLRRLCVGLT